MTIANREIEEEPPATMESTENAVSPATMRMFLALRS
jgi:hypothetical protein